MFSAELDTAGLRDGESVKRSDTVAEVCTMGSVLMISGSVASVRNKKIKSLFKKWNNISCTSQRNINVEESLETPCPTSRLLILNY